MLLPAGQHQLVWRYDKDATLSQGEDTARIDNLRIENISLASWHPADIAMNAQAGGLWRVPAEGSPDARLRVRSRLGSVVSPWTLSQQQLIIEEPTAVGLAGFQAGTTGQLPWFLWGLGGVVLVLGAGLVGMRRRLRLMNLKNWFR